LVFARFVRAAWLNTSTENDFTLSPESTAFFTALSELSSVVVRPAVGRSRLGKSLMVELMAQTHGRMQTCHLRVNPSSAAETHGIDAILLIDQSLQSGLLLLDTAGSDVMMTAIQTNILFVLALSIATSLTFFVDGELEEEEIVRLASSLNMAQQVVAMLPNEQSLPKQGLTVAYSSNSGTCHFEHRESASVHTTARLSTSAGVRCACRLIIQEAFAEMGIQGLVVPCVEAAIAGGAEDAGSGSVPAAEVLNRPTVRETLLPTAQALLSTHSGPAWNGAEVVQRIQQIMTVLNTAEGREVVSRSSSNVDALHGSLLAIEITKQRALLVKELNDWDLEHLASAGSEVKRLSFHFH
jgi:hypothetical protein